MKKFILLDLLFVFSLTMTTFLLNNAYTIDRYAIEEMFQELHPDLDRLDSQEWKECDELDKDSLERICFEVLSSLNYTKKIIPAEENFTYIIPPRGYALQEERVVRHAPVKFRHAMEYTTSMTLIQCLYNETEFFLAPANGTHVFRLFQDPGDKKYYFKSGLHAVNFTYPIFSE